LSLKGELRFVRLYLFDSSLKKLLMIVFPAALTRMIIPCACPDEERSDGTRGRTPDSYRDQLPVRLSTIRISLRLCHA
jgi:hypothetical protein